MLDRSFFSFPFSPSSLSFWIFFSFWVGVLVRWVSFCGLSRMIMESELEMLLYVDSWPLSGPVISVLSVEAVYCIGVALVPPE